MTSTRTCERLALGTISAVFLGAALANCAEAPASDGAAGASSAGSPTAGATTGGASGAAGGSTPVTGRGSTGGALGGAGGATQGGTNAAGANPGGGGSGGQAGAQVVPNALESLPVPVDGQAVTGKVMLTTGDLFLLKATGTVDADGTALDAEYGGFAAAAPGQDLVTTTDVGVDVGFKVERTPQGTTAGRKKWFGAYRADHAYYVIVTGSGAPLSLKLLRPAGTGGSGAILVSVLRLSPTATALAAPLETVLAPVTKPTLHSTMATDASLVYLLQASGDGKVGGANLARGDADWMDYTADGTGKVDIGDEDVDYGLGVDESDPTQTPRHNWWGPFRVDHSYYQLYAGTGSAIGFSYYDVGNYGDNSPTDKITVNVFKVP